jgi:hypothetical protein
MKLFCIAALASLFLAGCASTEPSSEPPKPWLLLVPPVVASGSADPNQPLSKWQDAANFDTASNCNAFLTRQQFYAHSAFGPLSAASARSYYQIQAYQALKGQCVARNDPRLAQ